MAAGKFTPEPSKKDCTEKAGGWGTKSTVYDYIWKGDLDESTYPEDACQPRYHGNAQIDNLRVNTEINGTGDIDITGSITSTGTITGNVINAVSSVNAVVKAFNIPHPTQEGKRLVHGCLEGPENGVYVRGRLTNDNVIVLPEYWDGLVDQETITVNLTQIGSSQDLMVERIEWGKRIVIRSANASAIDCYYTVNATRKDVPPLQVEQDA